MTTGEALDLFRQEMSDQTAPYLWSDDLVLSYIDDAQTMFCRLTDGISDATTAAVTQISVVPATQWYTTHPSLLKLRSAVRTDTGRDIEVLNQEDMAKRGYYFDGSAGPLRALIVGMELNKIRAYPVPNETMTAQLTVFRKPLVRIVDDQEFEIADEHHAHLQHWIKHRAYLKQDAETYDRSKAEEFEGKFRAYCKEAREEDQRKRHKTRVVAYGGL